MTSEAVVYAAYSSRMTPTFAEDTFARAVDVLRDARRAEDDRADAACVLQVLLRRMVPSEAEIADLLVALSFALDVDLAIRRILGALASARAPVADNVIGFVERLMEREFRAGRTDNLHHLVFETLDVTSWARRVRPEWFRAALDGALEDLPEAKTTVALLIGSWLHARGEDLEVLASVVEERPELVSTGMLPVATRWHLHRAARPTVAGWRALSVARGPTPTIEPSIFGSNADVAVETLEQAIGETPDEARRVTMAGWLISLRGSSS